MHIFISYLFLRFTNKANEAETSSEFIIHVATWKENTICWLFGEARKIEFWPSLIKDFVKREILLRDKRKKLSVTKHGCDKQWQFEHWILDSDKVVTTFQLHLEQHRFSRYVPIRWAGLKNFHRNRSHDQVIYALKVDSSNKRSLWTFQIIQRI